MVVGDAIGSDLLGCQAGRDVDGHLFEPQLLGRLPAGVPDDDHAFVIDDNRLPEAEFLDAGGQRIDTIVIVTGVVLVRPDVTNLA